jgi:hypothetical protein
VAADRAPPVDYRPTNLYLICILGYRPNPLLDIIQELRPKQLLLLHDFPPDGKVKMDPVYARIRAVAPGISLQIRATVHQETNAILKDLQNYLQDVTKAKSQKVILLAEGSQRLTLTALLAAYLEFRTITRLGYTEERVKGCNDLLIFPWRRADLSQQTANTPLFQEVPELAQLLQELLAALPAPPPASTAPLSNGRETALLSSLGYRPDSVIRAMTDSQSRRTHIFHNFSADAARPFLDQIRQVAHGTLEIHPIATQSLSTMVLALLKLIREEAAAGRRVLIHFGGGAQRITIALTLASYLCQEQVTSLSYHSPGTEAPSPFPVLPWCIQG